MTERRACRLANQPRGTQRHRAIRHKDEDALTLAIILLASQYGRDGLCGSGLHRPERRRSGRAARHPARSGQAPNGQTRLRPLAAPSSRADGSWNVASPRPHASDASPETTKGWIPASKDSITSSSHASWLPACEKHSHASHNSL